MTQESNLPFDPKAIFAELHQGKTSEAIAHQLGIKRAELVRELRKHPEDWREMRLILQYVRMEDANDEMDAAAEKGDYQKVKAYESVIRTCQWEIERVFSQVYGEAKNAPANPVQININLRREDAGRVAAVAEPHAELQPVAEGSQIEAPPAPAPKKKALPEAIRNPAIELSEPLNYAAGPRFA